MNESEKKISTAVRLPPQTKSDIEAIALAWGVPIQHIMERAISVFLLTEIEDVKKGRKLQAQIAETRKGIG